MTKPEEVPQDVWDDAGLALLSVHRREAVSALIMAAKAEERKLCYDQAIAELLSGESEDESDKSYDRGVRDAAYAIRNRDTV